MANKIKGMYANFTFIGTPIIIKDKFYSSGKSEGGFAYHKVQFGVKTSDTNVVFVELSGGYNTLGESKVYSLDKENSKLEISWKDRLNQSVIDMVADFKKFKMNFESSNEKQSEIFLTEYDTVEYIKNNLTDDKRIVVQGQMKVERYLTSDGWKNSKKYIVQKIRLAGETESNKSDLVISFIFDKDSWSETGMKEDKKVSIDTYFTAYDKNIKGNVFVPLQLILDVSKVDFDNPKHVALFDYYKKCFEARRKEYFETQWHCTVLRGNVEEEITEDDFTAEQKIQIELGLVSKEQIIKDMRGKVSSSSVNEIRLIRPTNKFDGTVNNLTIYEEDDFFIEEAKNETFEEIMGSGNKEADNDDDMISAIFG